jgi:pentatricopeptide repeat protein
MVSNKAKTCIAGGYLCDGKWACCEECYDEMVEKGCYFEELGNEVYRKQKY